MEPAALNSTRFPVSLAICLFLTIPAIGQQKVDEPRIPLGFNLDLRTAARLRPQLMAQSAPANGTYAAGRVTLERLLQRVPRSSAQKWELRIVENDEFNAYSSPDGTIYVESGLAQLAGSTPGFWAALLSHEIAHVLGRDWARRYLYQQSLEKAGSSAVTLGGPGSPSDSWIDSQKASESLALFCRRLEIEADREGLLLMARAGYHPDFLPALYHALHAFGSASSISPLYAMHPRWEERDTELSHSYLTASIEFDHRWPEWYATPGGNPPVVVFAGALTIRKIASEQWEVQVPLRCQNLVGAVEVVMRAGPAAEIRKNLDPLLTQSGPNAELRQWTGCTSPITRVAFILPGPRPAWHWTDVYILDSRGTVLSRADLPKFSR